MINLKIGDNVLTPHGEGILISIDLASCNESAHRPCVLMTKYLPGVDAEFWDKFLNNNLCYDYRNITKIDPPSGK